MGLSNKWTFLKTQNKKSLEHQALQICNFGVNQANIEQDIYSNSTLWKLTKKTAWTSIIFIKFCRFLLAVSCSILAWQSPKMGIS